MQHTFYNVGHGDTIFIKPDKKEKCIIVRDMGCCTNIFINSGMKKALDDLEQFRNQDYTIDVIVSHAHDDHYKGFVELHKNGCRKIFRNTYIPYLVEVDRGSLLWNVMKVAVGMYLYFPTYSPYYKDAKDWLFLAPIMADLSIQVKGVSNDSCGVDIAKSHFDFFWPSSKSNFSLSQKELIAFSKYISMEDDFNKGDFNQVCQEIYSELELCFKENKVENHTERIREILKRKKLSNSVAKDCSIYQRFICNAALKEAFGDFLDNHSVVFGVAEEALYLSDLKKNAMDEMFRQCGNRIGMKYSLLKSAHHGTRICDELKKRQFGIIVHCCGKGNRRYGRPLKEYKKIGGSVVYMDSVGSTQKTF